MALEELLIENIGALKGHVVASFRRWAKAALKVRSSAYTPNDFWDDLKGQFVDNWDTWSELANFSGHPVTPTILLTGAATSLVGKTGFVFTRQRLENTTFSTTVLEQWGGTNVIPGGPANVSGSSFNIQPTGDLNGRLLVTMQVNAPAVGEYRGLALMKRPALDPEPLAWLIVIAT